MELKENITKQELVDYAVNKKIQEVELVREGLSAKLKEVRESIKGYDKSIREEREKETPIYIQKEYGPIIKLMTKKGFAYAIHTNEQESQSDLVAEIIYSSGNIVLEFQKISDKSRLRNGMMRHPMKDLFEFGRNCDSIIVIDRDEVTSEMMETLREVQEAFKKEEDRLMTLIQDCNSDISQIRSTKDNIKSQIIEQALSSSKDGKKLLVALQNIDFGKLKTLGA